MIIRIANISGQLSMEFPDGSWEVVFTTTAWVEKVEKEIEVHMKLPAVRDIARMLKAVLG